MQPFAVGCLLAIPGFFGGGMIAVALATFVGDFTRCKPPDSLPACNTFQYLLVGAIIGMLVLPGVVVWRLRRKDRAAGAGDPATQNSDRS